MRALIPSLLVAASLLLSVASNGAEGDNAARVYGSLGANDSLLRDDFNNAKGSVRLLFVVDPVCPGCLRGLDDLNKDLLAKTQDPRVQTFVIHLPVIGAQAKDVGPAARLLQNPHVRHYWDGTGKFGETLARSAGLKNEQGLVYAWDVWLIYGPDVTWDDVPPRPLLLMHQLRAFKGSKEFLRLDSKEFARNVLEMVDSIRGAGVSR